MAMVATSMVSTGEAVCGKAGLGSNRDAERGTGSERDRE
jgi:hypothetical protein